MKILVIGGGTAGWITALYAKKANPSHQVILVESDSIGILGAGEGSVPYLIDFFSFLDISINELIANCKATIKNGIKFSNWSVSSEHYYHPFLSMSYASNDYNYQINPFTEKDLSFSHIIASKFNHKLKDYCLIEKISEKNLVPFKDNVNEFEGYSNISLHFDANLLAQYLRTVGESRGIVRKEGIVLEIINNENGYIESIKTENEEIKTDFVFDCTGFNRLIIGKHYKSEWHSHEEHLPANSAIPFFLPMDKEIPPYTESIAMDYGWMWKIPLQHRYGCGYVFDNNQISSDYAKKEIDAFLGLEVESPRSFSFSPGCYKNIWIKNSLAVGLSAGFVEPLEATSIWQAMICIQDFFLTPNSLKEKNKKTKQIFNKKYFAQTQSVVDFLYLHYITKKENTGFWKNFSVDNKMPESIENIFEIVKERPLIYDFDFNSDNLFNEYNYFYILIGNDLIEKDILKRYYSMIKVNKDETYLKIIDNQKKILGQSVSHNKMIESII